jgi:4-hydroxybenzoate polyprenyltransferase
VFTLGTILMRSAGCCINDVADREFDRHVKRTAQRPVTSGKVGVKEALAVGGAAGVGRVRAGADHQSADRWPGRSRRWPSPWPIPYAKRFVSMPQAVLGVAFSFGIPMAFSAVTGDVPWLAWWLLAGNLFWVLAYDTEYAMVDRDDDLRIGMKTSAITLGRFDVAAVMAFYLVFLLFWAFPSMKWSSSAIFMIAIVAALAQVAWHYMLIRTRQREGCFKAFRLNHWLGFTVFAGIALSYRVA